MTTPKQSVDAAAGLPKNIGVSDVQLIYLDENGDDLCVAYCGMDREDIAPDMAAELAARYNEAPALRAEVERLRDALSDLLAWERYMGGFEAPCWDRARSALESEARRV